MSRRIRIKNIFDHESLGKGHAVIQIEGDQLSDTGCKIYIKRIGFSENELGAGGWQASEERLTPIECIKIDAGINITVGPDVVGYMEKANYQLVIECDGLEGKATGTMTWKNVTPCAPLSSKTARGGGGIEVQVRNPQYDVASSAESLSGQEAVLNPVDSQQEEDSAINTEEDPNANKPVESRNWLIIIFPAIFVIVVAVGIGFLIKGFIPSTGGPVSPDIVSSEDVQEQIQEEVSSEKLFSILDYRSSSADEQFEKGVEIIDAGIEDVSGKDAISMAEQLFDMAASQGHAEAARRVAHMYDPGELAAEREGQYEANMQTAYTWYRKAIDMGSDEAKTDLDELHEIVREMAVNGNEQAQSLLNRRWPD